MTPEARRRRQIRTPVLAVTGIAWVAAVAAHAIPSGSGRAVADMAHAPRSHTVTVMEHHAVHASGGSLLAFPTGWPLMLAAMMLPLLIPALRHVYARSLPRRRWRALTLLIGVYAATWSAGGLVLEVLATAMQAALPQAGVAIALGSFLAVVWQVSPLKQRCLNRHHAHRPIAAFGRAADIDALRFGCMHALWCIGSCWALMLVPLLVDGWHLATMAIVSLWIWAEAFDTPVVPSWRIRLPVKAMRMVTATAHSLLQPAYSAR